MIFSFHPEAEEEFEAAVAWYEERETGLGLDFAAEVREAVRLAQSMPMAWPRMEENTRRVLVHRFTYGVLYSPDGDRLYILAVMHLRRQPGYWRDRLPGRG